MVQVSYTLYARSFSLIASGWVPGDVSFQCFFPLKWVLLGGNRFIAGFRHILGQERAIQY